MHRTLQDIDGDSMTVRADNGMISVQIGSEIREFAIDSIQELIIALGLARREAVDSMIDEVVA